MPKICKEKTHEAQGTTIDALPDDVMDVILSRLHEEAVPSAKAVCRRWRRIAATYHRLYPVRLCDAKQFQWCGWDAAAALWRRLPPLKPILELGNGSPLHTHPTWLASSRGLVLVRKGDPQAGFFVCDPVRRRCHALPALDCAKGWVDRMPMHPGDNLMSQDKIAGDFNLEVGVGGDPEAYIVRALGTKVAAQNRDYPLLVVYRSGAKSWEVTPTTGSDKATAFRPLGKPVVVGTQLFVVGFVGRAFPGRLMALDMETCVWRLAAVGVQFWATLVALKDRVLVVSEEKVREPGSEPSANFTRNFAIHSMRVDAAAHAGGLVLESRCNLSNLYPLGEYPNVCEGDKLWSVAESAGLVYVTCGSVQEPPYHKGVVYYIAARFWRRWSVGGSGLKENFSHHIPSSTQGFEFGMPESV